MKALIVILLLVFGGPLASWGANHRRAEHQEAPVKVWEAFYDGPDKEDDFAAALALDAQGNVYVTGRSFGLFSSWDYATVKYPRSGKKGLAARYNGPPGNGPDCPAALAVDSQGNFYVTGYSRSLYGNDDIVTIKYNNKGKVGWLARYDGVGDAADRSVAMTVDSQGNVYVAGSSYGWGTRTDFVTIKYNPQGQELWAARYNGPANGHDVPVALGLDASGNVYVTGISPIPPASPYGSAPNSFATLKYSAGGQQLWVDHYCFLSKNGYQDSEPAAMAVDAQGNVYVTGLVWGGQAGFGDLMTIKYDPDGHREWLAQEAPGNWDNEPIAVIINQEGNIVVTGNSKNSAPVFQHYVTLIKYAPNGAKLWTQYYNKLHASAVTGDGQDNLYVTARQGEGAEYGAVLIKFSPSGQVLWQTLFSNPAYSAADPVALAADSLGNIFLAGTGFKPTGRPDFFTVMYTQK
jgi:uncharacterized delta-60 repeat protein